MPATNLWYRCALYAFMLYGLVARYCRGKHKKSKKKKEKREKDGSPSLHDEEEERGETKAKKRKTPAEQAFDDAKRKKVSHNT